MTNRDKLIELLANMDSSNVDMVADAIDALIKERSETMNDQDIRLECLRIANGDLKKAEEFYRFIKGAGGDEAKNDGNRTQAS